jgi:hypothetical protein
MFFQVVGKTLGIRKQCDQSFGGITIWRWGWVSKNMVDDGEVELLK